MQVGCGGSGEASGERRLSEEILAAERFDPDRGCRAAPGGGLCSHLPASSCWLRVVSRERWDFRLQSPVLSFSFQRINVKTDAAAVSEGIIFQWRKYIAGKPQPG
jgi:hypothetical protein